MDDASNHSPAWLESAAGARIPVRGSCFLGRAATNHIVLADDRASRRHAVVQAQAHGGEFWIVDLGSANGTYLNGRRVTQPARLTDRDHLELAGENFTFRHDSTGDTLVVDAGAEHTVQDIRAMECWLLVADIEGSTQTIQRIPAAEASQLTARWLAACKQVVDESRGTINKFLGDGFFAYWPDRDPAIAPFVARAVRELRALQAREAPRFRLVLHLGKVFVGGASLGEENLMGTEVNFIFRLEKLAANIGRSCLLSESAATGLRPHLPLQEEGRHAVTSFDGEFLLFAPEEKPL